MIITQLCIFVNETFKIFLIFSDDFCKNDYLSAKIIRIRQSSENLLIIKTIMQYI
jgi:hypothetical protein